MPDLPLHTTAASPLHRTPSMTKVLDHGYVTLVESWGSDERIIEAARMSTGKGFQGWGPVHEPHCPQRFECANCPECDAKPGDEKLLSYLWEHRHTSPFEMAGAVFEIYAPIFVIREWQRHRVQALSEGLSFNEMSGRYTTLPNDYYIPSVDRLRHAKQSTSNKQGSEGGLDDATVGAVQSAMISMTDQARAQYEWMLSRGVAREVARMVLPVNQYTRLRVSANLWGWLHFLGLRLPSNAQWEIRQFAGAVGDELMTLFPRTYELFARELPR